MEVLDKVFVIVENNVIPAIVSGVGKNYSGDNDTLLNEIREKEVVRLDSFYSKYKGIDIRKKIFERYTDALSALLKEKQEKLIVAAMDVAETKNKLDSFEEKHPFLNDKQCPYAECPWKSGTPGDPEPSKDCDTCVDDYAIHTDDDI